MWRMDKVRLDVLLVERGLVPSREKGRRLIMAGQVRVAGEMFHKPSQQVPTNAEVTIEARQRYVSRGGFKLEAALDRFPIDVAGCIAADVGASTGGFTDCLLQCGVDRVYAIDVGYGQIAWKLRNDPRVTVMERTNARYLTSLPEPIDLVTIDASFISLKLLLPAVGGWLNDAGQVIVLIKPQFEAGRSQVRKGGVVRDPAVHRQVLSDLIAWAEGSGWGVAGLIPSPLVGPAGNVEYLAHLTLGDPITLDRQSLIEDALVEAESISSNQTAIQFR
jgi:23S rRNA (cytidine1920-2'-O)/16S rRNA (cytidine1409-2'-O)-methyltransferase